MPEIPQIPMGRPNVEVQSASIWSEQCSMCVYQANEAGDLHIEEVGDQINPVSQRYVDNVKEQRGHQETLGNCSGVTDNSRIYHQLEEECSIPNTRAGVPRIHPEFLQDDDCASITHTALTKEVGETNDELGENYSTRLSTAARDNGSSTSCSAPSTTPLQEPGSSQDNSTEKRILIRLTSERQPRHETRYSLVVGKSQSPQRTPITDQLLGSDNRVRRFHDWMGSQLPGKEHRWAMDTTG